MQGRNIIRVCFLVFFVSVIYGLSTSGGAAAALTNSDCGQCHTDIYPEYDSFGYDVNASARMSLHHAAGAKLGIRVCSYCHNPAEPEPTCLTCHDNPQIDKDGFHLQAHTRISVATDCQACHSSSQIIEVTHLENCFGCHTSTDLLVVGTIASGIAGNPVDCNDCHGTLQEKHATPDHSRIDSYPDCTTCHGDADIVGVTHKNNCSTCHESTRVAGIIGDAVADPAMIVNCATCHGTLAVKHPTPDHSDLAVFSECSTCHFSLDIVPTTHKDNCATCHASARTVVKDTITSGLTSTAPVECNACHGIMADKHPTPDHSPISIYSECATCHSDTDIVGVTHKGTCATCHGETARPEVLAEIADGDAQDCATCHGTLAVKHPTPNHSDLAVFNECTTCHGSPDIVPTTHKDNCATCHASARTVVQDTITSGLTSAAPVECNACHGTLAVKHVGTVHDIGIYSECAACHTDADVIVDTHKDNCVICHADPTLQEIITDTNPQDCATCHGILGVQHASTLHVIGTYGDCSSCHTSTDVVGVTHKNICLTCHGSTDSSIQAEITDGDAQTCFDCHGDYGHPDAVHSRITNVGTVCYDCHGQNLLPPPANQAVNIIHKGNCLLCHTSTRANVVASIADGKLGNMQDCNDCHTPAADPKVDPQDHHIPAHDNIYLQEQVCADCHVPNVAIEHDSPNTVSCSTCHAEPFYLVPIINSARSSNPGAQPISCANCHATNMTSHRTAHNKTVLPSAECAECHDVNVAIEHVDNRTLECTTCHNSTNTLVQNAIANGKGHLGVEINCSDCHTGSLDHKAAHDNARLDDEVYCANCHAGNVVTEHVDNRGFTCGTCHNDPMLTLEGGIIDQGIAGTTIYCTTCHTTSDHTNAHNKTTTSTTDTTCVDCHDIDVAVEHVTDRGLECTVCHLSTDQNVIDVINSGKGRNGTTVVCAACHADAGNHKPQHDKVRLPGTGAECVECHVDNVVTEHVENRTFTCLTCHDSTDTSVLQTIADGKAGIQQDCYDCHADAGGHEAAHDMTDVPSQDCTECHSGNVATEHVTNRGLACTVCHGNSDYDSIIQSGRDGNTVVCTDCHTGVNHAASHNDTNVPEPICENCHAPNVFEEHVLVRGRECSICHNPTYQGVIDQGVANEIVVTCISCHVTPDHHNNDTAKTGMCTACHVDPRPLVNDPQQLACRQCHVDSQGYVKTSAPSPSHKFNTDPSLSVRKIDDFGACFACHAPVPFHAKPSSTPDCRYNTSVTVPGRGTFNIFRSQFQLRKESNERYESCENTRNNYSSPKVSFSWFPIVYQGKAMNVPAFNPAQPFPAYPHNRIKAIGNCGNCHTVGTVVSVTHGNDCVGCHLSKVKTVQNVISWGRAGNDVNCYSCHGEGGHEAQHDMTELTQPSCSSCHVDNVVAEHLDNPSLTCATCHNNPAYATVITKGKNGFKVTCFDCHGTADHLTLHGATNVDMAGCADCHNPNVVTEHVVNRGLDCVDCHESIDPDVVATIAGTNGSVTCSDCHGATDHEGAHKAGPSPGSNCKDCHSENVVTEHVDNQGLTCGVCHDNPIFSPQITSGKNGTLVICEDCHGQNAGNHEAAHNMAGVPSADCAITCHDANVVVEHVTDRGFTCADCHDNPAYATVINNGKNGTYVTCYDCHGTNSHHNTTEAQTGDCTFCHVDPRLEIDPNAPVGQLACRQCHGTNQHNNGGPIQDYGACFSCHQPTPYHAKPTRQPSNDCNSSYAQAPGKGSFNLFSSSFGGENRGDTESCERRQSDYRNPAINFSLVTIVDQLGTNRQYTVPTFGTDGGSGGQDSVSITQASYDSRRSRITVYAENSMGNNATLTANYRSNTYPMSWSSYSNRWQVTISTSSCSYSVEVVSSAGGSDSSSVSGCR